MITNAATSPDAISAPIESFLQRCAHADAQVDLAVQSLAASDELLAFLREMTTFSVYSSRLGDAFEENDALAALSSYRQLRSSLGMKLGVFLQHVSNVAICVNAQGESPWQSFADAVLDSDYRDVKLSDIVTQGPLGDAYRALLAELEVSEPHAVYPTSPYRESDGHVVAAADFTEVEATMTSRTFTSIKVVEGVLNANNSTLRDVYKPHGRCVCVVDQNVEEHFGQAINRYFKTHGIQLDKLVYRAMEVDKGIQTVERMLGDFKRLGVSRNEPVLIVGGGVLSDTGGLACALYHRSTPYVMLSTSVVAGIDAGPSPRTCCDGFGYKNLFGAYHTPILSITDRSFFATLKEGWLRHGIAEIIKMAVVKDVELFEALEEAGPRLIDTRFGATGIRPNDSLNEQSNRILGRAIKSYVEAEYGNLYETHQCRPHAYGHTWSPGYEIPAGMLHGHAVSTGMGLGAYLAMRNNWIDADECQRIMRLISSFDLSLWHDVLSDTDTVWAAQTKMVEKRGGNLAAPLPSGGIGSCGYLNTMTESELKKAIADYRLLCKDFPRDGLGIEAHCADVGLEDPSTVGCSLVQD
jgi:3-dehydroquinate synthase